VGSVLGGLLWARRAHTRRRSQHLALLTALLAAGLAAAAAAAGLVALGVALVLAGMAIGPLYVVAYLASDDFAPPGRRTEASTWINVAANAGGAAGTAAAGALVDASGPTLAFLAGGALLAVTALALRAAGSGLDG
jgi:predicted MFS family arabinose efflux permease